MEAECVFLNLFSLRIPTPKPWSKPGSHGGPGHTEGVRCAVCPPEPLSLAGGPGRGRPAQGGGALGLPPHAGTLLIFLWTFWSARRTQKAGKAMSGRLCLNTPSATAKLCDLGQVTQTLCASISGICEMGGTFRPNSPRVAVRKVWALVHSPWDRARCTECCVNNSDRGTEPTARLARCPSIGAAWGMLGLLLWATPSPQKVLLESSLDTARSLSWGLLLTEAHLLEAFWPPDASLSPVIVF